MDSKNIVLLLGFFIFVVVFNVMGIAAGLVLISLNIDFQPSSLNAASFVVALVATLMFVRSRWPTNPDDASTPE